MTRNNYDDLFIINYLFIRYIEFLLNRVEREENNLKDEYLKMHKLSLKEKDRIYIGEQENRHLQSIQEYKDFLDEMKKKTSDFFENNQKPFPLYSKESYRTNIQAHKAEIERLFDNLFKN